MARIADAPGQPHNGASCVGIPVGSAQTGEGGHHIAAVGVGNLGGEVLRISGGFNDPQLVPQPLDGGSGNEDGALQGIVYGSVQAPGDGGDEAII